MNPNLMMHVQTAEGIVLGLDPLPDTVWKAWERYQAARAIEPATAEDMPVDLAGATTPDEIRAVIDKYAAIAALSTYTRDSRADVLDILGRNLIGAVTMCSGDLISTCLVEPFDTATTEFADAYSHLPADYTDNTALLQSSPDTLGWFQKAKAAADVLTTMRAHRNALDNLVGTVPVGDRQVFGGCMFAKVDNYAAARRASEAMGTTANDDPLGCWGRLMRTKGVTGFHMLQPAEHRQYATNLDPAENHYERNAQGHVFVEV